MILELKNIFFKYQGLGQKNSIDTISNISLTVIQGELIGIVGASGSGKTTLIQVMKGLLKPANGQVLLEGQTLSSKVKATQNLPQKIGLVNQFPEMQFFENTIFDEIAFGLRNCSMAEDEIHAKIENVLNLLELNSVDEKKQSPFKLSEGQKRRVAIASILVMEPEIIILDEPTSALDYSGIQIICKLVNKFHDQNRTVIIASHDMDFIYKLVHRVIALDKGKIVFDGTKEDFFSNTNLLLKSKLELPRILQLKNK